MTRQLHHALTIGLISSGVLFAACNTGSTKAPVGTIADPAESSRPARADESSEDKAGPGAPTPEPPEASPTPSSEARTESIPASILPAGCTDHDTKLIGDGDVIHWDGKKDFRLGCQEPSHRGWTMVAKVEDYGAGSARISYAYRKKGWMLLFGEICCSSCEVNTLTECEPWAIARLYPPSDLVDCAHSKICDQVGLCVQKDDWCVAEDEDWGLSL